MIVYPPAEPILPGQSWPGKRRIAAVVVIVVVLAAMGWDAVDVEEVLVIVLAALGLEVATQ